MKISRNMKSQNWKKFLVISMILFSGCNGIGVYNFECEIQCDNHTKRINSSVHALEKRMAELTSEVWCRNQYVNVSVRNLNKNDKNST